MQYALPEKIGAIGQPSVRVGHRRRVQLLQGRQCHLCVPLAAQRWPDGQWRYGTYWLYTWASKPEVMLPDKPYHSGGLNELCFDSHVEWQRIWRGTINQMY